MLLVCQFCPKVRSVHPYASAARKRMICDTCKPKVQIIFVGKHRIVVVLKRPRDGIGRHTRLKI